MRSKEPTRWSSNLPVRSSSHHAQALLEPREEVVDRSAHQCPGVGEERPTTFSDFMGGGSMSMKYGRQSTQEYTHGGR